MRTKQLRGGALQRNSFESTVCEFIKKIDSGTGDFL